MSARGSSVGRGRAGRRLVRAGDPELLVGLTVRRARIGGVILDPRGALGVAVAAAVTGPRIRSRVAAAIAGIAVAVAGVAVAVTGIAAAVTGVAAAVTGVGITISGVTAVAAAISAIGVAVAIAVIVGIVRRGDRRSGQQPASHPPTPAATAPTAAAPTAVAAPAATAMAAPAAATAMAAPAATTTMAAALGIGSTRRNGQRYRGQEGGARDQRPPGRFAHRDQSHPNIPFRSRGDPALGIQHL